MKYVIYKSDYELIVCAKKDEKQMLQEYFIDGGRLQHEYDREVVKDSAVAFYSDIHKA